MNSIKLKKSFLNKIVKYPVKVLHNTMLNFNPLRIDTSNQGNKRKFKNILHSKTYLDYVAANVLEVFQEESNIMRIYF